MNWRSYCSDITLDVFGEDGGHACDYETAFIQAIDETLVHPERYTGPEMTTANPSSGSWSAYPSPSSIGLYQAGQGYTRFDPDLARTYYTRVIDKIARLVEEIVAKWDLAGL